MKKWILCTLSALVLLGCTACAGQPQAQTPNPFISCKTLDEAAEHAGFAFTVPEGLSETYGAGTISAIKDDLIQVQFDGDTALLLRKGAGEKDISGDYNTYDEVTAGEAGGHSIELRGKDGLVYCAVWTADGHAFAIGARSGLPAQDVLTIAGGMA